MHTLTRLASLTLAMLTTLAATTGCSIEFASNSKWPTLDRQPALVIAHRGDPGNYPEHTLAGYESALRHGADYIEVDIVLTKDRFPVCRHGLSLGTTTDIATRPDFAIRKTQVGDQQDWLVSSLTLAELKTLRAKQPINSRPSPAAYLSVPTLAEVIELLNRHNENPSLDKKVGLYIEIKHPKYHTEANSDISRAVLDMIDRYRAAGDIPPIILQCFNRAETERLASMSDLPVVWLTSDPVVMSDLPKGIAGLGLHKDLIQPFKEDRETKSAIVEAARARGLFVHAWTFRDDQMQGTGFAKPKKELDLYMRAGIDGFFTDYPETGVEARDTLDEEWTPTATSERVRKGGV